MIELATLGVPALLAIIMVTSQSAYANNIGGFDCYGETDCVDGWNTAIGQATQDYDYNHGYNLYVYHWHNIVYRITATIIVVVIGTPTIMSGII
jgi:hypothetical protein